MKLNPGKCKEIIICFSRQQDPPPALNIEGIRLERVHSDKVLGLTFQSDLKWNIFIQGIVVEASKRLHIFRVFTHNAVPLTDLVPVYIALICSVFGYCAHVWHTLIPAFLSDNLERVEKRAFRIIYPDKHCHEALSLVGCQSLSERRCILCVKTFNRICEPHSRLHHLVPAIRFNDQEHLLRNGRFLTLPKCKTERSKRSLIPAMLYDSYFNYICIIVILIYQYPLGYFQLCFTFCYNSNDF